MATEQIGFQSGVFGFRKTDVLTYIDRMSAENLAEQKKATEALQELTQQLSTATDEKGVLAVALDAKKEEISILRQALAAQTQIATTTQEQMQMLEAALKKAEETAHDYQTRLFAREGEATMLRRDKALLTDSLAEKQQQLDAVVASQNEKAAQAQQVAPQTLAMQQEMRESADDMAVEVAHLKQALATLDDRIADSLDDLQRSTQALSQALTLTEDNMQALGVKLVAFPQKVDARPQAIPARQTTEPTSVATKKTFAKRPVCVLQKRKESTPTISSLLLAKISKMIGDV